MHQLLWFSTCKHEEAKETRRYGHMFLFLRNNCPRHNHGVGQDGHCEDKEEAISSKATWRLHTQCPPTYDHGAMKLQRKPTKAIKPTKSTT